MATGTVKWFNNAKGYGFVLPEDSGEDLFIHYSSIQMDGYKSLKAGQEVEYDVQEGPKGLHAVNIRSSKSSESPLEAAVKATANGAGPTDAASTDDDLHLNPMHNVPKPETASRPQVEVEVELD